MWKIPVSNRLMDLQNYPRSRKANRIQQPEALDSKTFSTFSTMSDGQVLPLQLFNYFFCVEEFNWKAGPTHCDGRQWTPGLGTGTGTARLKVTCILNAASAWLQLNPADCGRQGRAAGLSWDHNSNPDPGGGRHGWGRSGTCAVDPTSRARYTGRNMHNYDINTNISVAPYPVFGVCTLVVQWECMRTVCRRSRARIPFAFFFNLDQHRYELGCTGMYSYVPVCTSMNQYVWLHTSMYWYVLVCTSLYLLVTLYTSMYKYTHSPVSM